MTVRVLEQQEEITYFTKYGCANFDSEVLTSESLSDREIIVLLNNPPEEPEEEDSSEEDDISDEYLSNGSVFNAI